MKKLFSTLISLYSLQAIAQADSIPTIFEPGIISTGEYESHPCFSPDGNSFYFVKSTPNFNFWTILVSKKQNGKWQKPEIAPFSGKYSDADPYITKDGSQLYFISNRPVNGKEKQDMDIWVMDKLGSGWGEPRNLGNIVNTEGSEWYPTIAANGNLYFGSERKDGKGRCDLYKCEKTAEGYKAAVNLGDSVNTAFNEFEPYISPDEKFMIFMGINPAGFGGSDLFISFNRNGTWTKAKNLGRPFSSGGSEYSPLISYDNKYFYWTSSRSEPPSNSEKMTIETYRKILNSPGNGLGDIYFISAKALFEHMETLNK